MQVFVWLMKHRPRSFTGMMLHQSKVSHRAQTSAHSTNLGKPEQTPHSGVTNHSQKNYDKNWKLMCFENLRA